MMDRNLLPEEEQGIFDMEQNMKKMGSPMQLKTINVPALLDLDLYFYVIVSAKPRESSDLDKAMMTEMLNQGQAITAMTGRPMNPNKIIERFERVYRERDLFQKDAPQMEQVLGMSGSLPRTPGMQNMGKEATPAKPSVNTMQGQMPSSV